MGGSFGGIGRYMVTSYDVEGCITGHYLPTTGIETAREPISSELLAYDKNEEVSLTPPGDAQYAVVQVQGGNIRYTYDKANPPTTGPSFGFIAVDLEIVTLAGRAEMLGFSLIGDGSQDTGELFIEYWKFSR